MYRILRLQTVRRALSTKTVAKPIEKDAEHDLKEFERMSNISQRIRPKKPQKPPFIKNCTLGIVDSDILAFPELEKAEWESIEAAEKKASVFLNQLEVKESRKFSRDTTTKFGKAGLFGLQASRLLDGRELGVMESLRLHEAMSKIKLKWEVAQMEHLGVDVLSKFGSDKLKRKYLEPLIRGDITSAFCLLEPAESVDHNKRSAIPSESGKHYILNGRQPIVIGGSSADIYIVVAQTWGIDRPSYTCMVVERDIGGITSSKCTVPIDTEVSSVNFENVTVSSENLIGLEGFAENVLQAVYPEYRLSMTTISANLLRNLVNNTTQHIINTSSIDNKLYETDCVRSRIGEMTTSLYAIESLIYLTAGLIDTYENQDCEVESQITKVFATEQTAENVKNAMQLVGSQTINVDHWCHVFNNEATCYLTFPEVNDVVKMSIALGGLQYAGRHLAALVKKGRNPMFNAAFVLTKMWKLRKQEDDKPTLNLYLHQHLHPSLIPASQHLEYSVLRLQYATELFLYRHGHEAINFHVDLRRLADCMIDIYAMVACLSRASRSYCIGLQHAEFEMNMAAAFCSQARERVSGNVQKLVQGVYATTDNNHKRTAKTVFKFKEYFPVHPIKINF